MPNNPYDTPLDLYVFATMRNWHPERPYWIVIQAQTTNGSPQVVSSVNLTKEQALNLKRQMETWGL